VLFHGIPLSSASCTKEYFQIKAGIFPHRTILLYHTFQRKRLFGKVGRKLYFLCRLFPFVFLGARFQRLEWQSPLRSTKMPHKETNGRSQN
jgi:hypothetical protein